MILMWRLCHLWRWMSLSTYYHVHNQEVLILFLYEGLFLAVKPIFEDMEIASLDVAIDLHLIVCIPCWNTIICIIKHASRAHRSSHWYIELNLPKIFCNEVTISNAWCNSPIQHSILAQGEILITSGGSTLMFKHKNSATHPVFICTKVKDHYRLEYLTRTFPYKPG